MKKNYEMTEEDLNEILDACKPVPLIALQCGPISSPQENANKAWARLGAKMGFDPMTVEPTGQGDRFFSAVSLEKTEPIIHPKEIKAIRHDLGQGLELVIGSDGAWLCFKANTGKQAMFHIYNTFCKKDSLVSGAVRDWLLEKDQEWDTHTKETP